MEVASYMGVLGLTHISGHVPIMLCSTEFSSSCLYLLCGSRFHRLINRKLPFIVTNCNYNNSHLISSSDYYTRLWLLLTEHHYVLGQSLDYLRHNLTLLCQHYAGMTK